MSEKLGASLAAAGYSVSVIGFESTGEPPKGLGCHSLEEFSRLSLRRYLARWKVLRKTLSLRPDVFIFSTYELIFQAIFLKVMLGSRIIYDVRENYYRNILYSEGLPFLLRGPLALIVRGIEKIMAPMIDHFFLAERGYEKEFRFHRGAWTVIENKALPLPGPPVRLDNLNLVFSGTLSESTGVFRAIHLAEALHARNPDVTLTIAGHAASVAVQQRIRKSAEGKPHVRLVGIETLVPHREIVQLLLRARAGIIAYRPLPHTLNSVPTKLYEYLTAGLPIICDSGWPWVQRFDAYRPFVYVDFEQPVEDDILGNLDRTTFYPSPVADAGWDSEVPKLLLAIKNIV